MLLSDTDRLRRVGAVTTLHKQILEGNATVARGARLALRRRLESDRERDYEVRDQINRALEVAASAVKPNAVPDIAPVISLPAIGGGAGSEKSVPIEYAADEIERILERIWHSREIWVAQVDDQNSIVLSKGASTERPVIEAKANFRDNFFNSTFKALKALGWGKGLHQIMDILAEGVRSVTRDAAVGRVPTEVVRKVTAVLLAKASKDWPIADPKQNFPTIALEIQWALRKIAPKARAISLKKQETAQDPQAEAAADAKVASLSPAGNVSKRRGEP